MQIVQGITFQNEPVRLDGKHFIDCVFEGCTLEYSGGELILERTTMMRCHHLLLGEAKRTAQYMLTVGMVDDTPGKWFEWTGQVN